MQAGSIGAKAGLAKGSKVGATITLDVVKPEGLVGQLIIGPLGPHQRCIYGRLPANDVVRVCLTCFMVLIWVGSRRLPADVVERSRVNFGLWLCFVSELD
jgi:hypothetical protein